MAYKVFTNGSPLPASDLNTYLMNQSVMVFANSTARSAALTSPIEGMVTYLEDTNKLEVYTGAAWVDVNDNAAAIPKSTVTTAGDLIVADGNASVTRLGIGANGSIPRVASGALGYLPIGTSGQVLTVSGGAPTWTTPAGGGGMTLLSTTTLNSAGVTISSISQDYQTLLILGYNIRGTSNGMFYVNGTLGSGLTSSTVSSGVSIFEQVSTWGTNSTNGGFSILIYNYTQTGSAGAKNYHAQGYTANSAGFANWGSFNDGGALSSITFTSNTAGSLQGTVEIWGIK